MRFNLFTANLEAVSFTHITIWFSSSTRMMNQKEKYIFNSSKALPRKKRSRVNFMSQRITRRDIDNTHRVNGIS